MRRVDNGLIELKHTGELDASSQVQYFTDWFTFNGTLCLQENIQEVLFCIEPAGLD